MMSKIINLGFKIGLGVGIFCCITILLSKLFSNLLVPIIFLNGLAILLDFLLRGNIEDIVISTYFFVLLVPTIFGMITSLIFNNIQREKLKLAFLVFAILFYITLNLIAGFLVLFAHARY